MMNTPHIAAIAALLALCPALSGCSDNGDGPSPEPDDDGMTDAELVHTLMLGTFYDADWPSQTDGEPVYTPAAGIELDPTRPSVRVRECDSYDRALKDFEMYLSAAPEAGQFVSRSDGAVTLELGDLGTVNFSRSDATGIVAQTSVSLAGARPYTLQFMMPEAFGDNLAPVNMSVSPGDIVRFQCKYCGSMVTGIIIDSRERSALAMSDHYDLRYVSRKPMPVSLAHPADWTMVRDAWENHRSAFIAAEKAGYRCASPIIQTMDRNPDAKTYVDYATRTRKDWSGIHICLSYFENSSIQSGEFRLRENSDFTNRDINPSNTFMSSRYDLSTSYERIFPEN